MTVPWCDTFLYFPNFARDEKLQVALLRTTNFFLKLFTTLQNIFVFENAVGKAATFRKSAQEGQAYLSNVFFCLTVTVGLPVSVFLCEMP